MNVFERGLLRYFSPKQLTRLQDVSIGIAGAGGLGSNCAMLLVRCGCKKFTLVDFDIVEASNFNRQFYFCGQQGEDKVTALAKNLYLINPELQLKCCSSKIEAGNIQTIFADCKIIVEGFDQPEMKAALIAAYANTDRLLISASGLAGYGNSDQMRTKKIGANLYIVGDFISGAETAGMFAPKVMLAAAKQADLVLSYVLNGGINEDVCTSNGELS